MIGVNHKVMVKEQTSSSQDVCLIQCIKTDCVRLQAIIQHHVFPLLLSVYSTPYLLRPMQSYFQDRFTQVLKAFLWF